MGLIRMVILLGFVRAAEQPRFASDVQLVPVDVQVAERGTGRPIDVLGANDFVLLVEGSVREIRHFSIDTTPLDIVFLLYGSGYAMPMNDAKDLQRGLTEAAEMLRHDDRAAVLKADSADRAALAMTDDKQQVRRTLAGRGRVTPIGQGDHLYDALRAAAMLFPKPKIPGRRRAIFALTNDAERNSKTSGEALITELLEADATANAIVLVSSKASVRTQGRLDLPILGLPEVNVDAKLGASRPGGDSVREVVEATGGDVIPGDLLHERLPEAMRRLRLRYLLGFYAAPTATRTFRRIEVRLTPEAAKRFPDAILRARRGYYTQPAQ